MEDIDRTPDTVDVGTDSAELNQEERLRDLLRARPVLFQEIFETRQLAHTIRELQNQLAQRKEALMTTVDDDEDFTDGQRIFMKHNIRSIEL